MIDVCGVVKEYRGVRAVDDLSFTVRPGRVTGFLGPNGAGKSTTMRLITGLDRPDAGRVLVGGDGYRALPRPLTAVGAMLDSRWVHPRRTPRGHLRWVAAANAIPAGRVQEVIDIVGLGSAADRPAGGLSQGMSQRLGIATALLGDPPALLLDEPVNGLDPEGISWLRASLAGWAAEGRAVLVSSHLLSEVALVASHLVVVGRGRLIADMSTREFVASTGRAAAVVRSPQQERLCELLGGRDVAIEPGAGDTLGAMIVQGMSAAEVGELAAAHGVVLHELSDRETTLEEAFVLRTVDAVEYRGRQS